MMPFLATTFAGEVCLGILFFLLAGLVFGIFKSGEIRKKNTPHPSHHQEERSESCFDDLPPAA